MFGWEFPPYNSGGLGTACYGLTKALSRKGVKILFVVPRYGKNKPGFLKMISLDMPTITIKSVLREYITSQEYEEIKAKNKEPSLYGVSLFEEIKRYASIARKIAKKFSFDIIHAHDWLTFLAAVEAKKVSGKPLVLHVHSIEYDRTGGNGVNPFVYHIEKQAMEQADCIIAVSNYTKQKIIENYRIKEEKIVAVHNGHDPELMPKASVEEKIERIKKHYKIVLFLGRITLQKGPDYFVYAAKKLTEIREDVIFIMVGTGDMQRFVMEKAAELGIADRIIFTGFLRGEELARAYKLADVYVAPSVSEPFGLTVLEAIHHGVPVIVSKQSGVTEVINHCLKADFWDTHEIANKINAVLENEALKKCLKENSRKEAEKINWEKSAEKIVELYTKLLS